MLDTHTHTLFSFDGKMSAREMVLCAQERGAEYYCITDHFDFDYTFMPEYQSVRQIDVEGYLREILALKQEFPFLRIGCELGFSKKAEPLYQKLPFEVFDYVLNSCHTVGDYDAYNKKYFIGKSKREAYKQYLDNIRASVDADYPFNTISHIGYVRKNAPYEDTALYYEEFSEEIDGILTRIIERDKALEMNAKLPAEQFMPEKDILQRYYQLGGRKLTFGSDSHSKETIGNKFDLAEKIAAEAGFTAWTVFDKQQPRFVPFKR